MEKKTDLNQKESANWLILSDLAFVIPLGFEPKTHSLEGCCSNPTELRNHHKSGAKVGIFMCTTKFSVKNILISFVFQSFCANGYKKGSPLETSLCGASGLALGLPLS